MRTIYLDMDGVFVNFDLHFFEVHGRWPHEVGEENFWKVFDTKRDGFFRDCKPYPGHLEFLNAIEDVADHFGYKVEMLTALPRRSTHPTAHQEKQDWMDLWGMSHVPVNVGPYVIDKQKWCKPGDILIDDKDLNIIQWRNKGGLGIHHEPGNFLKSYGALRGYVTSCDLAA